MRGKSSIWMCLYCAYHGCGERDNKHVGIHYKKTKHSHFVNLANAQVWCYGCNNFLYPAEVSQFFQDLLKSTSRKYDKWRRERQSTPSVVIGRE